MPVDLRRLRPVENLGFAYATTHAIDEVETQNYFLAARDHVRRGDRLFVTVDGGGTGAPAVVDYVVAEVAPGTVRITRIRDTGETARQRLTIKPPSTSPRDAAG